jgi:putative peptidoglycan lipid II flippase
VGMTVTGSWLAIVLRRAAGPAALRGAGRTLVTGVAAGVVAAALGLGLVAALPTAAAAASVAITVLVAAVTSGGFLAVAALLDRGTVQLLFRRRVADA